MDKQQVHLQMIQGVITRLSQNSFLLKGWSVVLISALFALSASNTKISFIYLAYFPAISFWILDAYFLRQERLFRKLFDYVRSLNNDNIDFSMNTSGVEDRVDSWSRIIFSKTLFIFHGTLVFSIVIVMLIESYILINYALQ